MAGAEQTGLRESPTSKNPGGGTEGTVTSESAGPGRRLVVVSRVHRAVSPRMKRAKRVGAALGGLGWDPVLWPGSGEPPLEAASRNRPLRRALRKVAERQVLIDRFEPSTALAVRRLGELEPDAGYLVVPPFSPAVHVARALRRAGKPYVLDTGDPWALSSPAFGKRTIAGGRSRRAERELLGGAAGIVVTTEPQAEDVRTRFPGIPLHSRPNGFQKVEYARNVKTRGNAISTLRLVHFGRFEPDLRVDLLPFLQMLADSDHWDRIELTQFGPDLTKLPEPGRSDIEIEPRNLIPWPEAVRISTEYDAALVLGNRPRHWAQLPSKAIEYLGLPIPRIALCDPGSNVLRDFTQKSPGYLSLDEGDPATAAKVAEHLGRDWGSAQLAGPETESWDSVAPEIAEFVDRCLRNALLDSGTGTRTLEGGRS